MPWLSETLPSTLVMITTSTSIWALRACPSRNLAPLIAFSEVAGIAPQKRLRLTLWETKVPWLRSRAHLVSVRPQLKPQIFSLPKRQSRRYTRDDHSRSCCSSCRSRQHPSKPGCNTLFLQRRCRCILGVRICFQLLRPSDFSCTLFVLRFFDAKLSQEVKRSGVYIRSSTRGSAATHSPRIRTSRK